MVEQQQVVVWDLYTLVDHARLAVLTDFLADPSRNSKYVEFDVVDKESFNILLTNGVWLRDQVSIMILFILLS